MYFSPMKGGRHVFWELLDYPPTNHPCGKRHRIMTRQRKCQSLAEIAQRPCSVYDYGFKIKIPPENPPPPPFYMVVGQRGAWQFR
jgi:hypothetical protein